MNKVSFKEASKNKLHWQQCKKIMYNTEILRSNGDQVC